MKNRFICAEEVAQELSVSKPYAYKLIRQLNEELKEKGFITISGRVNRQYFYERLYGAGNPQEYCYRRCLNQDVVVQGNPRVFKALKTELATVLTELKRIEAGNGVDEELLNVIELITVILGGLKGEDTDGK